MGNAVPLQALSMLEHLRERVPAKFLSYLVRRLHDEKIQEVNGQVRFSIFFPPYPSTAFERYCDSLAHHRRAPLMTHFAVTSRCPWKCGFCSHTKRTGDEMTTGQVVAVLDQLKGVGNCIVGLTGGEPLLRDDLEQLVESACPEISPMLITSGYNLTARRVKRLAAAGVDNFTIGIESADPSEHDAARQVKGAFQHARRAVEACREVGVHTALTTCAFREKLNSGAIDRMYELASEWGVHELRMTTPIAVGSLAGRPSEMLSPEETQRLNDLHVTYNRRKGGPSMVSFPYVECDGMFGCGAGYHHLFIDAGGEVCPCDLAPLSFGNVRSEPLEEIWRRMGTYFPLPRCGCAVKPLLSKFADRTELPVPRAETEKIFPPRSDADQLPAAYKHLFEQ